MGILKGNTEGGSGGKRGHSNMDHYWVYSEEVKDTARRRRRLEAKQVVKEEASPPHDELQADHAEQSDRADA